MPFKGLTISTKVNSPDTRLTKNEIDELSNIIDDSNDRDIIHSIIDILLEDQEGKYRDREIDALKTHLQNPSVKLREITSTLQGVLMRLTPTNRGGARKRGTWKARKTKKS